MTEAEPDRLLVPRFRVEPGHVVQFERSLGAEPDRLPREGDHIPPTFLAAAAHHEPGYWLRPEPGTPWFGSGAEPGTPGTGRGLHAEQHYEFHRAPRVGDVLTAVIRDGRRWTKRNRRGQTLAFVEQIIEYRDQGGDPVVTERKVRIPEMAADTD
ncbi:MaoC family dehydratase N-terminal domain-containing protein [Yinghuangia sp. ASG 101]|uniref:FAS1-like dehydratase domain-containing protein n=1 Tax=Yinghuangia sp. ASG 101 TaxID=2896848 RepID=UPI001E3D81E2|nr:MaoC family dehydratase N-terminal domain-containing protein [Yinghuangia sp. ASG 101]UGQ11212.1 MaoC family dehydratase N-terminal domain-containing protein [Yinghuangia sp. ASG 101]